MQGTDQELEACTDKAGTIFTDAMERLQELAGWERLDATPQVNIYKRATQYGIDSFKIDAYIQKPVQVVANYIYDNWIELEQELGDIGPQRIVKTFSDGSKIRYEESPSVPIVTTRDGYIFSSLQQIGEDSWMILEFSAPLDYPPQEGYVRGELKFRIQVYESVGGDANKTHISTCEIIDPKGSLPNAIVNKIASGTVSLWKGIVQKLLTNVQLKVKR